MAARYKFVNAENSVVQDINDFSFIPVTGNWRSDAYQQWVAAGNVTDPYVAPTPYVAPAVGQQIPTVTSEPDAPASGSIIYNLGGTTYIKSSDGTVTGAGDK